MCLTRCVSPSPLFPSSRLIHCRRQYLRYVKPSYDNHVSQTSRHADIIVPGQRNDVAIDVISQHIKRQLNARAMRLRTELSRTPATPRREMKHSPFEALSLTRCSSVEGFGAAQENTMHELGSLPPNVHLLPQKPQLTVCGFRPPPLPLQTAAEPRRAGRAKLTLPPICRHCSR